MSITLISCSKNSLLSPRIKITLSEQELNSKSKFQQKISDAIEVSKEKTTSDPLTHAVEIHSVSSENSSNDFYKGTAYIMWGNIEEEIGQYEWNQLFMITRYLTKHHYKVILNPYTLVGDLQLAMKDPLASLIVWSSHGDGGLLRDKNFEALPFDIFNIVNPHLKQIIISACDGEMIKDSYKFNALIKVVTWVGETDSTEFIQYFSSNEWLNDFK